MNIRNIFRDTITYLYLKWKGVDTKFGYVELIGFPIIKKTPGSHIRIGKGVTLVSNTSGNIVGINHPVIIATLTQKAQIIIGNYSGLSGSSVICVEKITVGNYVGLGANSNIFDTDFHTINPILRKKQENIIDAPHKAVSIGNNVWIASSASVLKGINMGDCSVAGYGSVVTKDVPPNTIVAGVPAKIIKKINVK